MRLYHISEVCHGDTYTFKPRIPNNVFVDEGQSPIEDTSTPRICFSKTIGGAIKAVRCDGDFDGEYFVYAIDTERYFVPNKKKPHYKYGPCFNNDMLSYSRKKDPYKGCVPDASETKEVWVLHKVKATLLCEIDAYNSRGGLRYRKIK